MSQIVKLRRSSVSGQKPTNANLQLGELALNTTDGKVYMAKSGSLGPSVEELISTNTVNTGSINITGDITGSIFTGSFKGDGSQLYNIPSSGVTGLELNKIVDGSATASISQTDGLRINTKTEITGSVIIDGLLTVNRIAPLSGSNVRVESSNLVVPNGGIFTSFNIEASGSVSASTFSGSAVGLINVPFQISGSDLGGNTYNKQFTKLQFDDSTGLNVSESVPGTAFISIGSHFKDIFVSGSPLLSATGSDAFEVIGAGGLGISTSITDTNGNGYIKELTISATSLSSSLNNRMDTITGSISSLSSSVVLTSQTGSMTVLSASYAATASFALNAGGGGSAIGSYTSLVVTSASSTWSFAHNTGQRYPIFQVFDNNGYVVIPSQIQTIDDDNANIIFPSPQTGRVIASLGGGNGTTQPFTSSSLWTVDHYLGTDYPDVTVWDSNRNIVFPNRIESVNTNQIKIYFSQTISGNVSVSRGGHIVTGSITWANVLNKPSGIVSGSSQLTGSYDTRYVLSGSITQTTWDNIANKPSGLISGSVQVDLTSTTGYSTFSSSISTSIGSLSSSVATTTSGLSSSIDSLSSSVATTTSGLSSSIGSLSSSVATTTSGLTSTITSLSSSLTSSIGYLSSSIETTTSGLSSSIGSLSSSVASINNTQNGRLDSLETASGSIRTNFNTFTSSYNTGSFTGSFKGDGGQLYNIPSSGITGLSLFQIASGSVSASISPDNGFRVNTDVYIDGTLTAKEIHTDYVTSSVLYQSGSTKFGDTSDDNHLFTGSVLVNGNVSATSITGSINFNNLTNVPTLVSGSSQINITGTTDYSTFSSSVSTSIGSLSSSVATTTSDLSSSIGSLSSSIATTTLDLKNRIDSIEGVTGSISSLNSFTSSINTTIKSKLDADGVISGSSQIIYSGLTGIPSGIVSGSSQISYTGITNIPSGIVSGSEQLTGSYDTRYVLSGSITQTTWDNIASKPSDIVSSSNQISAFGFLETSSFNTYTSSNDGRVSSLESFTSSLNTNYVSETEFGTYTGSINTFTSGVNSYTSSNDGRVSSLESKTGSYATTGSNSFIGTENVTGSLIVSSSLKVIGTQNINGNLSVTGSVVISGSLDLSNANVDNSRYLHTQGTSGTTWNIVHNLDYLYPSITVYDASDKVMLPSEITSIDANTTQLTFAVAESGHALASVGGISTSTADRYLHTQTSATGSWVIDHNIGYKYVTINVYDGSDEQLIPQKITAVSVNRTQIDFATPTTGNAIITVGGPRTTSLFVQTGSFYNTTTNIGISGSLVVTGDVDGNSFNTTSDKKLKTNLVRIENALDKIEKLNGYTFDWLEEYSEDRTRQIGMVADEVYEVQPELISHRNIVLSNKEEKIKLLDYSKVTAILIEAIKELNDKITKLENKKKKK